MASTVPTRKSFTADEARHIGEEIGIDWAAAHFDVEEFRRGMDVELEHGLHDAELDDGAVAALRRPDAAREGAAVDVEALVLLRRDEAVVLRLVEPDHRSAHRLRLSSRGAQARVLRFLHPG